MSKIWSMLPNTHSLCVRTGALTHDVGTCVCAWRLCNQSPFGTLQEVINSHDYCAATVISKVLHNSLCGEGWLNQSTWKGEKDVRFAASCRGPSASLSAPAVSLLCEEERVWTSKRSNATLETETISKGSGERWHRGEPWSMILKRWVWELLGSKVSSDSSGCILERGDLCEWGVCKQHWGISHNALFHVYFLSDIPFALLLSSIVYLHFPTYYNNLAQMRQWTDNTASCDTFSLTLVSRNTSTAARLESRANLQGGGAASNRIPLSSWAI